MPIINKYAVVASNRWAIISLLVGVSLSVAAALGLARFNHYQAQQAVIAATEQAADTVENRFKLYQYGLRGARGSILTMSEHALNRERFDRYSLTRNIDAEFPGARGFGFIRRVAPQDEAAFLAQARADGWPDFTIRQLNPNPAERFVIEYIYPLENNLAAVGLDIASEPSRRQAALAAMRSGEVRLTGPITLVQATGNPQQSFLILMPIYRNGVTPDTLAEREAQAIGWSFAPLFIEEVLKGIQAHKQAIHLDLRDITEPSQSTVFYQSHKQHAENIVLSHRLERDVYGRRWQIELGVHPQFISQLQQPSALLVLIIGLILSTLLASLLGVLNISRARQLQITAEQAKLAAIVESSADAIIGKDLDCRVTSWNNGAEKLFGYSAQEALGQELSQLVVPETLKTEEAQILASIKQGKSISSFNTQRQDKHGQLIPVSVTVSPIRNVAGRVVGASKTVRDISAQVAAEAKIHQLNSTLEAQVAERTEELRKLNMLLGNVLRSASEVAIIATDLQGIIRIFNTGAQRMLGYKSAELIGKNSPEQLHLHDQVAARAAALSAEFAQPIEGFRALVHKAELGGAETREWTYVRKDGSHIPVSLSVTAMRDEQGELNGYLGIAVDLSVQKAAAIAVATARDQLLLAADVAELGIWSWDIIDNSLHWNERMFELYGQPLSLRDNGLNYEHWRMRVHPDDVDATTSALQKTADAGDPYEISFRIVRPDGQVRIIQAGAAIERDAKGQARRITGINRDVTAQHELEARLRDAKEQADAASAAKSSFLANMSHEIRTPMNAVLGMLHLVQNTELNGRQQDYISKAETAAKALLGLLNDILDYSKIDAGKLQLDIHSFALETLLGDLAIVLSGNQGSKNVEMLFDLDPQLPSGLVGDSMRLQQVLINLAGNALKFTEQGQVVMRVSELQRCDETVQVRIEVTDTGIGISADQLTRIFEGFNQAQASTTRRFGGTGLGLVIAKRLIHLMGAELHVSSQVGSGSRFWFDIQLGIAQARPVRAANPSLERPMRILVADDNAVAGDVLVRMLQSLGWQPDLVSDGLQAVARAQQMHDAGQAYDVILLDWRMPGMDGLRAAHLIQQQHNQAKPIPMVIMLTAYGREVLTDAQQTADVPFASFLTKPVTPQQLADTIQGLFSNAAPAQPSVASMRAALPKRLNGKHLLVVEDNLLNRQVAFELLQGEGAQVILAEGGIEGVRLAIHNAHTLDAVLMDIQMPDIDGLEATRRLRADARSQALTIIAMTANASKADEQMCRAASMDDFIPKPIDLEVMVARLLRNLDPLSAAPQEQEQEPAQTQAVVDTALVESLASISQRFGGNEDLLRNILTSFAPEQAKLITRLQTQLEQANAAGAAAALHAIKGSSGTMGARALSQLAAELEYRLLHDDAASQALLLADHSLVERLQHLLHASDAALRALFALPANPLASTTTVSASLPMAQWRAALQAILHMLEASDMQAIAQSEALLSQTPASVHSQYQAFCQQVHALDFAAALTAGQALLNSA